MSCRGCVYAFLANNSWACEYILVSGHRRGCEPGRKCTRRIEDINKMPEEERKRLRNDELFGLHDAQFLKKYGGE